LLSPGCASVSASAGLRLGSSGSESTPACLRGHSGTLADDCAYDRLERDDDEFFPCDPPLLGEGHRETKESPMRSVRVDLISESRRPLWPDGVKLC
jgi:hypothetical protein